MLDQKTIPLFSLSIFSLEGEYFQLHIFEPRYKQLLAELPKEQPQFGIYYNDSSNENNLGTVVELVSIDKSYSDGKKDITVKAIGYFKLNTFYSETEAKLYPTGDVQLIYKELNKRVVSKIVITAFNQYLQAKLDAPIALQDEIYYDNLLKAHLHLDSKNKYLVFNLQSEEELDNFIINHLRFFTSLWKQEKNQEKGFYLN